MFTIHLFFMFLYFLKNKMFITTLERYTFLFVCCSGQSSEVGQKYQNIILQVYTTSRKLHFKWIIKLKSFLKMKGKCRNWVFTLYTIYFGEIIYITIVEKSLPGEAKPCAISNNRCNCRGDKSTLIAPRLLSISSWQQQYNNIQHIYWRHIVIMQDWINTKLMYKWQSLLRFQVYLNTTFGPATDSFCLIFIFTSILPMKVAILIGSVFTPECPLTPENIHNSLIYPKGLLYFNQTDLCESAMWIFIYQIKFIISKRKKKKNIKL